ncbi:MAG: UDP-N-acetylmuramoyl-tripeptide--D-alanyl-D-alanine ligase [Bdellovibrionales bacterium]|nr:UDP-N-acetylmuramoyl-tripeptide--D-alanyl-D-alanine ligase [Bdellovibrionales bacterium]
MVSSKLLFKVKSIKTITCASYFKDKEFELKINTDSRSFQSGQSFVALVGENFDAFNYLEGVLDLDAKVVVVAHTNERADFLESLSVLYPKTVFITVTDTLIFLQELSSLHLRAWKKADKDKLIIGVTGSNGKTTHKEMLYFLLNSIMPDKVLATKGNLNNHIGVPLTIFGLTKKHKVAIIEMGMNHRGEIKVLCDIAMPSHGMITNIGAAHIEFLKSMENIFKEKGTLYDCVVKNSKGKGVFVVNADDTYLNKLKKSSGLTTYGEKNGDVKIAISNNDISFNVNKTSVLITNNNISEHHNLKNLAGTSIFVSKLFPKKTKAIAIAASQYMQPSMNRSQWLENIFLDAYNANPSSMRVSVDSFVKIMKDKGISLDDCYFVLGDMNELGDHAPKMHEEIADHVKDLGIKNLTFIGRYQDFYLQGYPNPTSHFAKKEDFYEEWKKIKKSYKFIFIKASRSLQLETLINID